MSLYSDMFRLLLVTYLQANSVKCHHIKTQFILKICWNIIPKWFFTSVEFKERVDLYLYSLYGPSWLILGCYQPLILPTIFKFCNLYYGDRCNTVVKVLCYKSKVAGSIPAGVIGIFHWHNTSDRTMALGSTQPLTEMSTRNISWG